MFMRTVLFLLPLLKPMCLYRPVCSSYFAYMPNMSRAMKLLPPIRVWCLHSRFSQISSHGQLWNQMVCIYVAVVLWEFSYHVHTAKLLIHCFVSFQGLSNNLHTAKPWYGHSSTDKSSHSTHKKVCPYTLFHVCCRPLVVYYVRLQLVFGTCELFCQADLHIVLQNTMLSSKILKSIKPFQNIKQQNKNLTWIDIYI